MTSPPSIPSRPVPRAAAWRWSQARSIASPKRAGLEVRTPASLKDADEQHAFAALELDAAVVVAYGLLLPKADSRSAHGWAVSICMPRCCRAGAAPRPSSAR